MPENVWQKVLGLPQLVRDWSSKIVLGQGSPVDLIHVMAILKLKWSLGCRVLELCVLMSALWILHECATQEAVGTKPPKSL